jgi:hypothetical protein
MGSAFGSAFFLLGGIMEQMEEVSRVLEAVNDTLIEESGADATVAMMAAVELAAAMIVISGAHDHVGVILQGMMARILSNCKTDEDRTRVTNGLDELIAPHLSQEVH